MYTAGFESTTLMLFVFLIFTDLSWPFPFVDVCVCNVGPSLTLLLLLPFWDEENKTVASPRPPVACEDIFMIFGQCWRHLVKNGFVTPIIRPGLNFWNYKRIFSFESFAAWWKKIKCIFIFRLNDAYLSIMNIIIIIIQSVLNLGMNTRSR